MSAFFIHRSFYGMRIKAEMTDGSDEPLTEPDDVDDTSTALDAPAASEQAVAEAATTADGDEADRPVGEALAGAGEQR